MNRRSHLAITLAALALLACASALVAFRLTGDSDVKEALARRDALAWLRSEFSLTDDQFARIKAMHEAYSVECEAHCLAIQEAAIERDTLRAAPASDPARLQAAEREVEHLRLVCETAIAAHVRRCAAEMSPEAGARYLALVLPRIADFDHKAPPDVGVNRHGH